VTATLVNASRMLQEHFVRCLLSVFSGFFGKQSKNEITHPASGIRHPASGIRHPYLQKSLKTGIKINVSVALSASFGIFQNQKQFHFQVFSERGAILFARKIIGV